MSKLVLILGATSVGLGLLSLHLVKQMRAGEATITQLQVKVATLEKQQQARPASSAGVFVTVPIPTPQPEPSPAVKVATAKVASPDPAGGVMPQMPSREEHLRAMRESREQRRQLMQDPEYREAMRLQARSNYVRQYPGVIQELGLDPQQADEFFGLLADQQQRMSDEMESLWQMDGLDPAAQQEQQRKLQQQAAELQKKSEAEIAAQLGQDKLQAWKQYQSTLGARFQLEQMRMTLAGQGVPLSDDVSKSVLRAMADAQKAEADQLSAAVSRGAGPPVAALSKVAGMHSPPNVEQYLEATKKRNQRTLDAISPYLSFEQRAAIEKEQEAQLKVQEAHMRLRRGQNAEVNANVYYGISSQ